METPKTEASTGSKNKYGEYIKTPTVKTRVCCIFKFLKFKLL